MRSRPITERDYERVAAMLRDEEEYLVGRASSLSVNDLREWLSRTDLANDRWLYEDGGELAAMGWLDLNGGSDAAFAVGVVHQDWKGRGLCTRSRSASTRAGAT